MLRKMGVLFVCVAACSAEGKPAPDDRFEQAELGSKSDHQSMLILGELQFGGSTGAVQYQRPPRYLGISFQAGLGDSIDVRVRALDGGDPVAWVVDSAGAILASNDDASATTLDSRIQLDMPDGADPTHYVIFRDYDETPGLFAIDLGGELDLASCKRDEHCQMIEAGCCALGDYVAVRTDRVGLYQDSLECEDGMICPRPPIFDHGESAICDNNSHTCEIVLPQDIQCGSRSLNPHECPPGWDCEGPALAVDGFGECVAPI
jgi:hypothetical protein